MDNTKIVICSKLSKNYSTDLAVYIVDQKSKDKPDIAKIRNQSIVAASKLGDFKAGNEEIHIDYFSDENSEPKSKRFAFAGIGLLDKKYDETHVAEKLRTAGGNIAKLCKKLQSKRVCVILQPKHKKYEKDWVLWLAEGILLGDYTFDKYKTPAKNSPQFKGISDLRFKINGRSLHAVRNNVAKVKTSVQSVHHARNMANEPGSNWTPQSFADYAVDISKKFSLKCRIFEKKDLEKMAMGGIIAVNRGSTIPPKMVVLEHIVSSKKKTLLLVGKGLTFDSGGVSLKPASGMEDMKYDMCGGAAVISVMNYVGQTKPDFNVIAIVPSTDNMMGGSALKPGDVICHYNKMTSEIINTDAEGRLILADALAYGIEKYTPDCVVDLATLTGAVIVGLGHHYSGLLSNNDALAKKLIKAGNHCGEPLWRLPLGEKYAKQIESKVADMKNTGGKSAGSITAGEYLKKFVGNTHWAHFDIAGTAWNFTDKSYIPEGGPSGVGVRTLIEFIERW